MFEELANRFRQGARDLRGYMVGAVAHPWTDAAEDPEEVAQAERLDRARNAARLARRCKRNPGVGWFPEDGPF